jgi:predicted permease
MNDLRYAIRSLARTPAFTVVAILSLALGLGANIAIYTIANAFLTRPIPGATGTDDLVRVYRGRHSPLQFGDLAFVRGNNQLFTDVIGERIQYIAIGTAGNNERVTASLVTDGYFATLGVRPLVGRLFTGADTAEQTVVLSHALWQRRFGGDPAIIGGTLTANGKPFQIVGVAPPEFASSIFLWRADAWFSPAASESVIGEPFQRWGGSLYATARLRPGATLRQANVMLPTIARRMLEADTTRSREFTLRADHANGISAELRQPATAASVFLAAVVGLVLLIACANVANLLLARATARRREISVRIALGAKRFRLMRQLLTESALLTFVAAGIGLLVASWSADLIARFAMQRSPEPIVLSFTPDGRVLMITLGLAAVTTLLFGLLPALRATSLNVLPVLREESSQSTGRSKTRSTLVAAQVALCTVLLACSTLFLRSLVNARVIDPGFNTAGIVDVAMDIGPRQLDSTRGRAFYDRVVERVKALPEVRSVTLAALVPLGGSNMQTGMWLQGASPDADRAPYFPYINIVGNDYFRTMGIEIVAGRDFGPEDAALDGNVAIVNEQFARRLAPDGNAIGKQFSVDGPRGPWTTVIGVARNIRYNSLGERTPDFMYLSFTRRFRAEMVLHARTTPEGEIALRRALPGLVRELDPQLPPVAANSLADDMRIVLLPAQLGAALLGVFGTLALLLASLGIYGVASYSVAQRTRELGIRSALGAAPRNLMQMILGQSLRVAGIGMVIGVALALAAARLLASQLYGVSATDPMTFVAMPLFLIGVAALATYVPARRATRVDPVEALRSE